jgi:hypothetical protein
MLIGWLALTFPIFNLYIDGFSFYGWQARRQLAGARI